MTAETPSLESRIAKATAQLDTRRRQSHHEVPGHSEELIKSLVEVADLRFQARDYARSERLYREAEMHGNEAKKTISPAVRIKTKAKRALLHDHNGSTEDAIECYRSALAIADQETNGLDEIRAALHNNLAVLLKRIGETEKAELHYKSALVLLEAVGGSVENKIGTLCNNLGANYACLGDFHSAFRLFRRALRSRQNFFQDDSHPSVQQSYKNLGVTYQALGRSGEAKECFSKVPKKDLEEFLQKRAVECHAETLEQLPG